MAIQQTVWSLDEKKELSHSTLLNENELENLLVENIQLLSSDWIVIGRQVHTPYGGIIDLLCIDIAGNPIVVELKKGMTPREVTAQALDYASWVKKLDADDLAEIYLSFSHDTQTLNDAFRKRFGSDLNENNDDIDVQIVIVATDMDGSTERIIKYLQLYDIDINVLFFRVFEYNNQRFISRAWMFEPESSNRPQTASNRS